MRIVLCYNCKLNSMYYQCVPNNYNSQKRDGINTLKKKINISLELTIMGPLKTYKYPLYISPYIFPKIEI